MIRKFCRVVMAICLALLFAFPLASSNVAWAETNPLLNKVLQVLTGSPQWDGAIIHCSGENSMDLERTKTYNFTFRAYTPNKEVGLRFQANTFGGWEWDMVADLSAEKLQPSGWYEISGKLNLNKIGTTDMPRLALVKSQEDNESEIAKLWIDDFVVTEATSGKVVFSEDFESGSTNAFRDNGGVCSVVTEQAIFDDANNTVVKGEHALDVPSLKEIYKNYFLIGNIINPDIFGSDASAQERYDVLKHHYNALTYENDMKPDSTWGPAGDYGKPAQRDFTSLDEQIGKMINDGFNVIGHTLAWHGQSPNWLNLSAGNRQDETAVYKPYTEAQKNLKDFIDLVAGRFYNRTDGIRIYSWDVLNEAFRLDRAYPIDEENWGHHALGHIYPAEWISPWFMSYSKDSPAGVNPWDYIYDMFTFARQADPSTMLYYNDYGMEEPTQVQIVVSMVNALNAQWAMDTDNNPEAGLFTGTNSEIARTYKNKGGRLLIEGIGMQEHDTISTNIRNVEAAIHAYAVTGCKVSITELDVGVPGYNRGEILSAEDELKQARYYAELFAMFKKNYEYIDRVTFWGLDDNHSWRSNELCLLFNGDLRTKEAYYAVADPVGWLAANSTSEVASKPEGKSVDVTKGTITIPQGSDWEIGTEWDGATIISTDTHIEGDDTNAATAKTRVLWDDKFLYVLVEVTDSALRKNTANEWEKDSVEIFFSETNINTGAYASGDGQYRINYENLQSFGSQGEIANFQSAARIVPDRGYDIMMVIPFTVVTPKAGISVGFDVQVNDRNAEDTKRSSVMMWNDPTGNSYASNTNWGNLTLTETAEPITKETETVSESNVATPEPAEPDIKETESGFKNTLIVILSVLAVAVIAHTRRVNKRRKI